MRATTQDLQQLVTPIFTESMLGALRMDESHPSPRRVQLPTKRHFLEVVCNRCPRHDRYGTAMLVAKYGREVEIADMLDLLSGHCPCSLSDILPYLCGAHFVGLVRGKRKGTPEVGIAFGAALKDQSGS